MRASARSKKPAVPHAGSMTQPAPRCVNVSTVTIAGWAGSRDRTTRSGLARRNLITCPAAASRDLQDLTLRHVRLLAPLGDSSACRVPQVFDEDSADAFYGGLLGQLS